MCESVECALTSPVVLNYLSVSLPFVVSYDFWVEGRKPLHDSRRFVRLLHVYEQNRVCSLLFTCLAISVLAHHISSVINMVRFWITTTSPLH